MTQDILAYGALASFILGAVAAIAGFRYEAFKRPGWQFVLAGLGALLKTAAIGEACKSGTTHFFNSVSDIYGLMAWALALSYLLALFVSRARSLGALALPAVAALMALSIVSDKTQTQMATPPALFATHIICAFLGYGLFLTACSASVLYLEQNRLLKRKTFGVLFQDLPSLERLEWLEILCSRLGLLIFTVALATGIEMAAKSSGVNWFDWKILSTVVTWLVFFLLVTGRALRWINGRTAAKCVLAGAALVLITFMLGHPAEKKTTAGRIPGYRFRDRRAA